jgi:hypothetical protein
MKPGYMYKHGTQTTNLGRYPNLKKKINFEGARFTVLHAGCSDGFLAGCSFLLNSKNNDNKCQNVNVRH